MAIDSNPLAALSDQARQCIERLLQHRAEEVDLSNVPCKKQSAVLVLLYEKEGRLRVLLTTRAKTLRMYPGQTALPGGKMDETDEDVVETAYREAFEEVGLPRNHPTVHTLCLLRPFFATPRLLVTPVIGLLTDISILERLKPAAGEVDQIFDHPLEAVLDPHLSAGEDLVALNSERWPSGDEFYNFTDWNWFGNTKYRNHRFRSSASSIQNLSAEVLIMTAAIAYDRPPSFTRYAPGQLTTFTALLSALDKSDFSELRHPDTQPVTNTVLGCGSH